MSELVVIVTRMTGDNEFHRYFNNNTWAVIYDSNNQVKRIPNENQQELTYDNNIIIVYIDGKGVKTDIIQKSLCLLLNSAINDNREILILVHPGSPYSIAEAKERILCSTNGNNRVEENKKITIAEYTGLDNGRYEKVEELANAISNGNNNIQDFINEFKEYIKKNACKPRPIYLIALSTFLPLDIDMQALSDKKVDKEGYLKQMYSESSDYHKSLPGQLKELQEKINKLEIKDTDGNRVKELIGLDKSKPEESPICKFLVSLASEKIKDEELIPLFPDNKIEDANLFYQWYRELARELKKLADRDCTQ